MKKIRLFSFPLRGTEKVDMFAHTIFGYLTIGDPHGRIGSSGPFGFAQWILSPIGTNSMSLSSDEKTLTVMLDAELLELRQPGMMVHFKEKSTVTFPERWEASAEINKYLMATKPVIIEAGNYGLAYTGGNYVMTIMLSPGGTENARIKETKSVHPVVKMCSRCFRFLFHRHTKVVYPLSGFYGH